MICCKDFSGCMGNLTPCVFQWHSKALQGKSREELALEKKRELERRLAGRQRPAQLRQETTENQSGEAHWVEPHAAASRLSASSSSSDSSSSSSSSSSSDTSDSD
ncbi:bromodomain-containing protein 2-like [Cyprinus carpio]|uniref:Bromodomain-containing protein 2-like n=1 Tax=Cyprinus carpio TaxID=7962 RepID=A0A9R0BF23_CYPCA|nr:bromodomain-containing protein 2-like [Cyprinus carpio]